MSSPESALSLYPEWKIIRDDAVALQKQSKELCALAAEVCAEIARQWRWTPEERRDPLEILRAQLS